MIHRVKLLLNWWKEAFIRLERLPESYNSTCFEGFSFLMAKVTILIPGDLAIVIWFFYSSFYSQKFCSGRLDVFSISSLFCFIHLLLNLTFCQDWSFVNGLVFTLRFLFPQSIFSCTLKVRLRSLVEYPLSFWIHNTTTYHWC